MAAHTPAQANAQYNGGRLERGFFDNIVRLCREYESLKSKYRNSQDKRPFSDTPAERNLVSSKTIQQISTLTNFFANRHLSEDSARDAHRRVYYQGEGADAGNKTLGGAAAYQAYLCVPRPPSEPTRQQGIRQVRSWANTRVGSGTVTITRPIMPCLVKRTEKGL